MFSMKKCGRFYRKPSFSPKKSVYPEDFPILGEWRKLSFVGGSTPGFTPSWEISRP
jgi:hypothetical protein